MKGGRKEGRGAEERCDGSEMLKDSHYRRNGGTRKGNGWGEGGRKETTLICGGKATKKTGIGVGGDGGTGEEWGCGRRVEG